MRTIKTPGEIPLETSSASGTGPVKDLQQIPTAVYLRVSTEEQEFDHQKKTCEEWFHRNIDHNLAQVYAEKKSGKGGIKRKEMNKLMKDAKANKFKKVLFWETSRLGRNVSECLEKIDQLWAVGVSVHILNINQTYDMNNPTSRMIIQQMLVFAEFERELIKERTMSGIVAKNAKLNVYAKSKKLPTMRVGIAGLLEDWVEDPFKREGKKGLAVAWNPKKEARFREIWTNPDTKNAYAQIADELRLPVNPRCAQKCALSQGKAMSNREVDDLHMKGIKKCYCGKAPSRKTIHKTRKQLGLDVRNEHSFKRKDEITSFDDVTFGFALPYEQTHYPCGKRRPAAGAYKCRITGEIKMKGGVA
jgi:hypothetical protein